MSVFIQNSDISIINSIKFKKRNLTVLSLGVNFKDLEGFLNNIIKNTFEFPLFFVLSTELMDDEDIEKVKKLHIDYVCNKKNEWMILKVESVAQLKLTMRYCEGFASNGFRSFMIKGESLLLDELCPSVNWNHPIEFPDLNWDKVITLIDIDEVGLTVFTDDNRINSTLKLLNYIPKEYEIDLKNCDI
ncbi:hypothetical protein [Bacillus weihaiensis]|uniref:hypothetical protein n=1 Tax=Bacillus weihaiensis TaxID=1547283 RepID=UPI0023558D72|nr:hypothetical protein [Bacillus weihaiensis]